MSLQGKTGDRYFSNEFYNFIKLTIYLKNPVKQSLKNKIVKWTVI